MGTKRTYICNKCDYSVLTSGGADAGMRVKIDTFICTHCKEVVDVIIDYTTKFKSEIPLFDKCPKCGSKDQLVLWDNRIRPCPKCDGVMEDSKEGYILWD